VAAALGDLAPGVVIAAAGGVTEANAADYAGAGASILVTSAPFFDRPADVKVTLGKA
jgi:molybdenum transport protein